MSFDQPPFWGVSYDDAHELVGATASPFRTARQADDFFDRIESVDAHDDFAGWTAASVLPHSEVDADFAHAVVGAFGVFGRPAPVMHYDPRHAPPPAHPLPTSHAAFHFHPRPLHPVPVPQHPRAPLHPAVHHAPVPVPQHPRAPFHPPVRRPAFHPPTLPVAHPAAIHRPAPFQLAPMRMLGGPAIAPHAPLVSLPHPVAFAPRPVAPPAAPAARPPLPAIPPGAFAPPGLPPGIPGGGGGGDFDPYDVPGQGGGGGDEYYSPGEVDSQEMQQPEGGGQFPGDPELGWEPGPGEGDAVDAAMRVPDDGQDGEPIDSMGEGEEVMPPDWQNPAPEDNPW